MTNTELLKFKAALEAKRVELFAELRGRVSGLAIEDGQPELLDWIQSMSERDGIASMVSRFSSTLADVERSLRDIDENRYGACMACDGEISLKRLQSIPWAAYCVRCQRQFEAAGEISDFDKPQAA